jgi:hypothetical protein
VTAGESEGIEGDMVAIVGDISDNGGVSGVKLGSESWPILTSERKTGTVVADEDERNTGCFCCRDGTPS